MIVCQHGARTNRDCCFSHPPARGHSRDGGVDLLHPLIHNRINMDVVVHASPLGSVALVCLSLWSFLDLLRGSLPDSGFVGLAFVSWPALCASVGPYRGFVVGHMCFACIFVFCDLHATVGVQHLPVYASTRVFCAPCSVPFGRCLWPMNMTRAHPLPKMTQCKLHHEGKTRAFPACNGAERIDEDTRLPSQHVYA